MRAAFNFTHEELCTVIREHLFTKHNIAKWQWDSGRGSEVPIPIVFSIVLDDKVYENVTISAEVIKK